MFSLKLVWVDIWLCLTQWEEPCLAVLACRGAVIVGLSQWADAELLSLYIYCLFNIWHSAKKKICEKNTFDYTISYWSPEWALRTSDKGPRVFHKIKFYALYFEEQDCYTIKHKINTGNAHVQILLLDTTGKHMRIIWDDKNINLYYKSETTASLL